MTVAPTETAAVGALAKSVSRGREPLLLMLVERSANHHDTGRQHLDISFQATIACHSDQMLLYLLREHGVAGMKADKVGRECRCEQLR